MVCQSFVTQQNNIFFLECIIFIPWILHFPQLYIQFEVLPREFYNRGFMVFWLPEKGASIFLGTLL